MKLKVSDCEFGFGQESIHDLAESIEEHGDDGEFMAALPRLYNGERVMIGGGATPLLWIELVD